VIVGNGGSNTWNLNVWDGADVDGNSPVAVIDDVAMSGRSVYFTHGDTDGGGKEDLVVVGPDAEFSVFDNASGGSLMLGAKQAFGLSNIAVSAQLADFDLDTYLDLVVPIRGEYQKGQDGMRVYWGSADGFDAQDSDYMELGDFIGYSGVGDFNCDGSLDLALVIIGESRVIFLAGDGNRGFSPDGEIDLDGETGYALVTGDFTGEGVLDVAVGMAQIEQVWIYNHI
jgi:hypothetical protein